MPPISTVNKIAKIFNGDKQIVKIFAGANLIYEMAGEGPAIPSYYVQVSSADFDSGGDYIGAEEYIILPEDKTSGYTITNPNVIGVATDGDYLTDATAMFYGHTGLYLELDYLNTSNVTTMRNMFVSSQATTLDLSSFDTSNVTDMYQMFYTSKATTLDLSSFDTSNVTDMYRMFSWAETTTLDLNSFDTSNVTNMSYMFQYSQATTLDLNSFDTSNVTTMRNMFVSSQATILDLSSFDTGNVKSRSDMFRDASARTGYARTQTDAIFFNGSVTNRPTYLRFYVK